MKDDLLKELILHYMDKMETHPFADICSFNKTAPKSFEWKGTIPEYDEFKFTKLRQEAIIPESILKGDETAEQLARIEQTCAEIDAMCDRRFNEMVSDAITNTVTLTKRDYEEIYPMKLDYKEK